MEIVKGYDMFTGLKRAETAAEHVTTEVRKVKLIALCLLYKIGDLEIDGDDLNKAYDESGLAAIFGDKFRRKKRNPRDVARNAVKTGEFRNVEIFLPSGGKTCVGWLTINQVLATEKEIVWAVKENWPDSENLDVPDRKVCTITYRDDLPERLHIDRTADLSPITEKALQRIQQAYQVFLTHYNGAHVRQMMLRICESMNPVPYRGEKGDGAYAVHPKYAEQVRAIKRFVKLVTDLARHPLGGELDCTFRITKIDDEIEEDRQDLIDDLGGHIKRRAHDLTEEIERKLRTGKELTAYDDRLISENLESLEVMAAEFDTLLGLAKGDISKKVAAARMKVREAWRKGKGFNSAAASA